MKIALIAYHYGRVDRGLETWVKELSENIKNHEIKIFSAKSSIKYLFPFIILIEVIKFNPQIIIPTDGGIEPYLFRIYSWLTGKKMIIVGQSGIGRDDYINLYSFPDCFVGLSTKATDWAKKFNPFIKTIYIPNAVNIKKFKPNGNKIDFKLQKPIILSVGALIPGKRHELTIKAVSNLKKGSLLIVGAGKEKNNLQKLGERRLSNSRFKTVNLGFEKMPQVYRSADLFTLATHDREAFGIVFIEAMASRLAVVANNDNIKSEIIGDAGILVDVKNVNEYSKAISKALKTKWDNKPREQAEKFSWNLVSKKYNNLFKDLLNE